MSLIYKLRESNKFKKYLEYALVFALVAYVFSIPSFSNRTKYNLITYGLMIIFGSLTLIHCFLYRGFKLHPVSLIIPVFVAFAFLGTAFYSKDFRGWFRLVLLSISLILFLYSFSIFANRHNLLRAIAIGLFIFTLYYFYEYRAKILDFRNFGKDKFRLGEIFDNPNGVASYMVISFASCLSTLLFSKNKIDLLFIIPLFTTVWVGFSTGSKTFVLAIAVFTLFVLYFKFFKHKWVYLIIVGALVGLFIMLINMPFMETIRTRFVLFFETLLGTADKADTSSIERMMWMKYGFYLGSKNMITGYGYGGFGIYSGVGTYTHSNISEVFCNFGIIGLLLFYSPLLVCLIYSLIRKRFNLSLVIPFFFYYMLISFSNVFYYNKTYYLMIALLIYCCFEEDKKRSVYKSERELRRILFTCDSMNSGGAERVISILSDEMAKNGLEVAILMVSSREENSFYKLNAKVTLSCLCKGSDKKVNAFKRVWMLRKYIKEYNPSVVISFLPHVSVYTRYALIGLDIHHVVSERNNPKKNPSNRMIRLFKNHAFRRADGGVFQSKEAQKYFGVPMMYKGVVINNPITVSGVKKTNYDNCNKTIISVGRFTEQKNTKMLIEAFGLLIDKIPDAKLKLYGDGPLKESLESLVKDKNLENNVVFLGNNLNWLEESKEDSAFVLTSNYEGMPNALIEALFAGIPVIATDCPYGVVRELITDNENGFLVKCEDIEALSRKMLEVLDTGSNLKDICDKNEPLIKNFDPKRVTLQWYNYLSNVVSNNYILKNE